MQSNTFSIQDTLVNLQIKALNAMQLASIEANNNSDELILLADTGSGKTLAFLIPVTILLDRSSAVTQALVVVSSRELALQIEQVFKKMGTG
jgi:ATP-independent RNA helicase DbpA